MVLQPEAPEQLVSRQLELPVPMSLLQAQELSVEA
jgi:hypothetical protein